MSGASSPAPTPSPLASLPVDLLPSLLEPLAFRRADLRNLCLVNQQWNAVATPLLYRWIRMFGRDLVNTPALFEQLAQSPRLCLLVRKLEIRVFPLSMILKERWAMEEQAVKVLRQARNVRELIWTRKGAMSDDILEAITDLPNLDSFEFNASAGIAWTPTLLLKLPRLRSLSVILPDRTVASLLPSILANQQKLAEGDGLGLEELTILCRESPVVNDKIMLECATALAHGSLTNLALAGCAKLTNAHLLRLLPSLPKLRHLALEATGISPSFYTLAAPHLSSLLSLKITHPGPRHPLLAEFLPSVAHLLRHTPQLRSFTLYHSGSSTGAQGVREWPVVGSEFIEDLVASVGGGLRKFECSGVLMRISTLVALTEGARQLRDLVAHLGHELELDPLGQGFANLPHLKTLHLLSQRDDVQRDDVLSLAKHCSRTLNQIGFRNRVWSIKRVPLEAGEETNSDDDELPVLADEGERSTLRFVESAEAFGAFRRGRYGAEEDADE